MALDPQVQELLLQISQAGWQPLDRLSPTEARKQVDQLRAKPLRPQSIGRLENRTIPSASGEIPIRIYTPPEMTSPTILVYFHGGGWVLGDLDIGDETCRSLALASQSLVISVDYRLAPESKFPAPLEDAYTATCWVAENADRLVGNSPRVGVAGDSAGGNLAAAVCLMARDRGGPQISYQVLIYPVTCYQFNSESYELHGQGDCGLSVAEMSWFWKHYLNQESEGRTPYASPLLASDLSNLPPALIVTAESDLLRDEAEAYAAKLEAAGVSVELQRYNGMIHGFVGMAQVLDKGKEAVVAIGSYIKNICKN